MALLYYIVIVWSGVPLLLAIGWSWLFKNGKALSSAVFLKKMTFVLLAICLTGAAVGAGYAAWIQHSACLADHSMFRNMSEGSPCLGQGWTVFVERIALGWFFALLTVSVIAIRQRTGLTPIFLRWGLAWSIATLTEQYIEGYHCWHIHGCYF